MLEFIINDYLSLKLEDTQTIIYINGIRFNQCKSLFLEIPFDEVKSIDEIESIDEAAENSDREDRRVCSPCSLVIGESS